MENQLLEAIRLQNGKITFKNLSKKFDIDTEELKKILLNLKLDAKILQLGNKYMLFPEDLNIGTICVSQTGRKYIFHSGEKISVAANFFSELILNDVVSYKVNDNNEAEIVSIVNRPLGKMTCEIKVIDGKKKIIPFYSGINLTLPTDIMDTLYDGDIIVVETIPNELFDYVDATFIEKLGRRDDPLTKDAAIALNMGFNNIYDDEYMQEIYSYPKEVSEDETLNRYDYRNQTCFTIDGVDTKDMDDGVYGEVIDDNVIRIYVHIADVSHYVKKDETIDKDAYERGTSVYLVDRVIPMLPHKLSNGICSLNPDVDRLALSCVMNINSKGYVIKYKIFKSVIKSRKQMTYTCVNEILENNKVPAGYEPFVKDLKLMNELSDILRKKMVNHGYLEFDRPEAKILVDDKCHPIEIKLREQRTGEKLIENFMIAANETVAGYIEDMKVPGIYRVHDKPNKEKLEIFIKFLNRKGYNIKADINKFKNTDYQRMLKLFKGKPEEIILSTFAIQTMSKAKYSDVNIGHYGIASKRYAHFTSPIRRYPDLTLHRLVKDYTEHNDSKTVSYWQSRLFDISIQSSKKEQDAINCERDVEKMKKAEYMENHIGEIFHGVISGVTDFGFFVELDNTVEGLVRLDSLGGDYYIYNRDLSAIVGKNSKKMYMYGDSVTVEVIAANKETSQVDFNIVKEDNNAKKEAKTKN